MEENQTTNTENTENTGANQENNQAQSQQNNNSQATAGAKEEKLFTQKDLDAKIAERLARERKKWQQQAAQQQNTNEGAPAAEGTTTVEVDVTEDARNQAAAIIAQANQRLIQAIAQSEATKLNINPDYIADAVRLADLSTVKVNDDGTVDSKSITKALEAVLTRMPVLKATTETPAGGFRVGGQGGNAQSNGWANKTTSETKRWNKNRY